MISFLTSSFIKYQKIVDYEPQPIDSSNGFADLLRMHWKAEGAHFLVFPSDPDNPDVVDHVTKELKDSFELSGFKFADIKYFDRRTISSYAKDHKISEDEAKEKALNELVDWSDVFFMAGGHAPTENAFMKECNLKGALGLDGSKPEYDGVYIGLSAGTLNAAGEVYLIPELPGESSNKDFVRFTDGLGITDLQIVPHADYEKTVELDGKKLIEDIVLPDSMGRQFYVISDGSFFLINEGVTCFFGDGEILENGYCTKIYSRIINSDSKLFADVNKAGRTLINHLSFSLVCGTYDFVATVDKNSGKISFFHISVFYLKKYYVPGNINYLEELMEKLSREMIVDDEKLAILEDSTLDIIEKDIERDGAYVRTCHINTYYGVQALKLAISPISLGPNDLFFTVQNITTVVDHDWMTDIYSRSGFLTEATKFTVINEDISIYSLVYTNIQGLKVINELYSTHDGDMVIFMERDRLREILKPVIIARLESDHFILITENSNLTEENLEKLGKLIYEDDEKQYPVEIRCGIYPMNNYQTDVNHMIDRAKLAESNIPESSTYAFYDDDMRTNYMEQRLMISELDDALALGEFKTYYQPIVDIHTGQVVSAEALVRWQHHAIGMISPGVFIPAFEQGGLITKIDEFMVQNVVGFNRKRQAEGRKVVPCAVNLSRVDFYNSKLVSEMLAKLDESEEIKDILRLEVTESAYVELESNALDFLEKIQEKGMSILLDDFGSGMSSMSTLESFTFDIVKLDMGFVHKIGKSGKAEAIIKSIISLSHDIGARVVAEGVETKQQLDFLTDANCDMIQGYYFYKPMPEDEFTKLLDD